MKERKEMEIVRNENNEKVYFSKLKVGDIFVVANDNPNIYLKTKEAYAELSDIETKNLLKGGMEVEEFYEHKCNVINLNDMQYYYFNDFENVIPKSSKLIVN